MIITKVFRLFIILSFIEVSAQKPNVTSLKFNISEIALKIKNDTIFCLLENRLPDSVPRYFKEKSFSIQVPVEYSISEYEIEGRYNLFINKKDECNKSEYTVLNLFEHNTSITKNLKELFILDLLSKDMDSDINYIFFNIGTDFLNNNLIYWANYHIIDKENRYTNSILFYVKNNSDNRIYIINITSYKKDNYNNSLCELYQIFKSLRWDW